MTPRTLREAVQDMRPLDALEYALTAYEAMAGEESAAKPQVGALGCLRCRG